MSSEDEERDAEGRKTFKIKSLPWRSSKLTNGLMDLIKFMMRKNWTREEKIKQYHVPKVEFHQEKSQ